MEHRVCKIVIGICLVALLLTACSKPELGPLQVENDVVSGRLAWAQLVEFKVLKADAILSWRATSGKHGKYKVRLFLDPPEKLKIQWLTPWGSVAGQVLIADKQFWFSNARQKQTWHGMTTDIDKLLQAQGEDFQIVATQFLKFWALLFSSPVDDDKNYLPDVHIEYLAVGAGDNLSLAKTVISLAGDEMHLRLFDFDELSDKTLMRVNPQISDSYQNVSLSKNKKTTCKALMPLAVEVLSRGGQIGIELRKYTLPLDLPESTFIYNLENFSLREYL